MQNTITYRRWSLEDLAVFTTLQKAFWIEDNLIDSTLRVDFPVSEQWQKELIDQLTQDRWFAEFACAKDEIIWFIAGYLNPFLSNIKYGQWAYIESIYVKPEYRSKGIGKQLINEFVSRAKANGKDNLRLMTNVKNEGALRLYKTLGFETTNIYLEKEI